MEDKATIVGGLEFMRYFGGLESRVAALSC